MPLTDRQRQWLRHGIGNQEIGNAIADLIDSGGNPVAANVAALGATADLSALSTADTYTDAAVNAVFSEVEARLDSSEAKTDEVIASLKAAGIMSSS